MKGPRTDKDAGAILEARTALLLAEGERLDHEFAWILLSGALERVLRWHLFRFESVADFVAWWDSGEERGAADLERLAGGYGEEVKREAGRLVLEWVRKYDGDPMAFHLDQVEYRRRGETAGKNEALGKVLESGALAVMLRWEMFKHGSFEEFYEWLGGDDLAAVQLREVIVKGGCRPLAAKIVSRLRGFYAGEQGRFDLDRQYNGFSM